MDDARRRILARRAAFVAVATAGLAAGACPRPCLSQVQPQPCLSQPMVQDAEATEVDEVAVDAAGPPPQPCLEVATPPDAGPPKGGDTGPMPCLNQY